LTYCRFNFSRNGIVAIERPTRAKGLYLGGEYWLIRDSIWKTE